MGDSVTYKILKEHLVAGEISKGKPISLKIDQVLTQDATGTMVYLQLEAMGIDKIKVPVAVAYIDHNTLQTSFRNPDDHIFLQTSAAKYGAIFSRPGNGICHQLHLERFGVPGATLIGSDSHTPTGGGLGMISMGTGGLDVAAVMAGENYEVNTPEVVEVRLSGKLNKPYVMAMDVILEVLRLIGVKGGLGKVFEYTGSGVSYLSLTERATITNMGAELGATTSVFPSDGETKRFLKAQKRDNVWKEIIADDDAGYDSLIEIDLSKLEPLVAKPFSPGSVVPIKELKGTPVDQVCIGSCTNSSYTTLALVANILKGNRVAENVSLTVSPGSKQAFSMISSDGSLTSMIDSGARILESVCGPCIGMGQAPKSGGVSIRTFNRNFKGRSGTDDAQVYLCSPVSAACMALKGEIIDPRDFSLDINMPTEPEEFIINDNMFIFPPKDGIDVEVIKGPNIKPIPLGENLADKIDAKILLKLEDNISTDDIMPAGGKVLPLRSNIPAISEFVFSGIDKDFYKRAKKFGSSVIVGAENYGQGSSREHAAIAPMFLGIKAVIAKSIARIHRKNLINYGILPLLFKNSDDYAKCNADDNVQIVGLTDILDGVNEVICKIVHDDGAKDEIALVLEISLREKSILEQGGFLPYIKGKQKKG
ncbi:MAG: aconitate hydratase [Candidatus Aureabacteria bacterium]|nr:aconitate hydratase [Candidatus Auribacterota bacterium]